MNCAEAKRLIAFTRKGELSAEEERSLAVHLRTCHVCASERASYVSQNHYLEKLRSINPTLRDPERNVQAILNRVRAENAPERQSVVSALVDRLIRALEVPGLRYALAVFVTVTVTGFVVQQVTTLRSVSALEARLSKPDAPRIRLAYSLPPSTVERLARSPEVRTIVEKARPDQRAGSGQVDVIRLESIIDLLNSPESRWVLHTLVPGTREKSLDSLITDLTKNVRLVLTYSKGAVQR